MLIDDFGLCCHGLRLAKRQDDELHPVIPAFAKLARPEQALTVAKAIDVWNGGNQALALIYLAHLGEPALKPVALRKHHHRRRLRKAGFDPSQPLIS